MPRVGLGLAQGEPLSLLRRKGASQNLREATWVPLGGMPFPTGTPTVLVNKFQPYPLAFSSQPNPVSPCHGTVDILPLPYLDWRTGHVLDGSVPAPISTKEAEARPRGGRRWEGPVQSAETQEDKIQDMKGLFSPQETMGVMEQHARPWAWGVCGCQWWLGGTA